MDSPQTQGSSGGIRRHPSRHSPCADRPPSGGVVRPRRVVRFARLIDRRGRAFRRTCGPRRLRGNLKPALVATQGDAA
jgi:hypothetical protein